MAFRGYGGSETPEEYLSFDGPRHAVDDAGGLEHLLMEDSLKDLISAKGLKRAWVDLLKRMRGMEKEQAVLENLASRDALNRDFVTRPEFADEVKTKLQGKVINQGKRLSTLETTSAQLSSGVAGHTKQLKGLQEHSEQTVERLDGLSNEIRRVEQQDQAQHQEALELERSAEERCSAREVASKEEFAKVWEHLRKHDTAIEVLQATLAEQQTFLASEKLEQHIRAVSRDLLQHYIPKVDMLEEAAKASEHCVRPVRASLELLLSRFDEATERLEKEDTSLRDLLSDTSSRIAVLNKDTDLRFKGVLEQIQLRSTIDSLNAVDSTLQSGLVSMADKMDVLKKELINKMQELNVRVGEFQILLENHEHALQHHAEELLNRSTKYDLVVCQQRIDHCAIKDKVDKEFKELQTTIEWQSSQLEVLGYGRSFAVPDNSTYTPVGEDGAGVSQPNPSAAATDVPAASIDESVSVLSGDFVDNAPLEQDGDSVEQGSSCSAACRSVAASAHAAPGGTPQPAQTTSRRPSFLRISMNSTSGASVLTGRALRDGAVGQQGFQPQTEVYSLLRMQLEAMAQVVVSFCRLCSREATCGFVRDVRRQMESELLQHMSCILHWISNRRAPLTWNPDRLASLALRCMQGGDPEATRKGTALKPAPVPQSCGDFLGGLASARGSRAAAAARKAAGSAPQVFDLNITGREAGSPTVGSTAQDKLRMNFRTPRDLAGTKCMSPSLPLAQRSGQKEGVQVSSLPPLGGRAGNHAEEDDEDEWISDAVMVATGARTARS